ncbi:MAG: Maf family protein [Hyphomicrobiaceae bacterium]
MPGDIEQPLILASASAARRSLLTAAGVDCTVEPSTVDEAAIKARLIAETPGTIATQLAEAKASAVSQRHPQALVIGADQVLDLDGEVFDKPADLSAARTQLHRLRDRAHVLHSAVALARDGAIVWRHVERARLTMRPFSDAFLDMYLAAAGDDVCASVGAYQLEGLGLQLFATIEGDYTTILGLPMLPVLGELRRRGHLPA